MKIIIKQRDGTTQVVNGTPKDFLKCPYCRCIVNMNTHDFDKCRTKFFNDVIYSDTDSIMKSEECKCTGNE